MKLILFILFFTQICFADHFLDGKWTGQGQLFINGNDQPEACEMLLEIMQTDTQFSVIRSNFKCPSMNIKNKGQFVLEIRNNRLYLDNIERGYIDDSTMYSYSNLPENLIQSYLLKSNGKESIEYSDHIDWSKSFKTEIKAVLNKTIN